MTAIDPAAAPTRPAPLAPAAPADERSALDVILKPRSIAVVGASRQPNTIGHQIVSNLLARGFTGTVYPVNPKADAIHSIHAYPSVSDIPGPVDVAVIVVPKEHVLAVAEDCARAGVRGLVVISSGFREIGPEGAERERQLMALVRRTGMRMVGPNCMGVINTDPAYAMNATFAPPMPPFGRAALVSQSGALGLSILDYASEYGIGISQFVSIGNKPDVSGNDLLEQWEHDPQVGVILMYVENFGNPQRFLQLASRITRRKPIIVVKSGRTGVGARAASSHTGALAASDVAVDALLAQAGVLRAQSIEELFDVAMAFGRQPLPRSRRTAILTNSGGPGILAADALEAQGMDVVDLSPATVDRLKPLFPEEASIRNPIDMIASARPANYRAALDALLSDANVDSVVAIFTPPLGVRQGDVAEAIAAVAAEHPEKPVVVVLTGREGLAEGKAKLHEAGIPAYIFPESAARGLAALCRHAEWLALPPEPRAPLAVDRDRAAAIVAGVQRAGRARLNELEALELLAAYGVPTAPARLARSADDAARLAAELGGPLVAKVVSPQVEHKSDAGGVRVGVEGSAAAREAFEGIARDVRAAVPGAEITGVLLQPMVRGRRETIVGVSRDRVFGPLLMFGLGGIFVEALRDVVFRMAPIGERDALGMVRGIRGARILAGMRGQPPVDERALVDALRRVSQLAADFPLIAELDVNPLLVDESGVVAVDARVRLEAGG